MPLPDAGSPWPPKTLAPVYADYTEADAWYSGDKARLAAVYGTGIRRERDWHQHLTRLWAQARDLTRHETRLHVPLAGDIASTSADLLFSEPPAITVETPATQARLDQIWDEGGVHMRLLEAAEVCAGIGDVYLKLAWDEDVAKRPILAVEHGDAAIPVFRWGRLVEVTFWRELERSGDQVVRLLEHHEPGAIVYALFEGTSTSLGTQVPLASREDTADIAARVDVDGRQPTGINLLTAIHVPNIRPNRRHRGMPYGRSDYAAPVYDLLDALDQTYTSWMRDLRLARARIIVPRGYLQDLGPGEGAVFDADREVYAELDMDPTQGGGITMTQFAIRVAEHEQTARALTEQAIRAAGYSVQTFGFQGEAAAVTATEVNARERRSMITRDRKAKYWTPALRRIVEAMLALDRALGWSKVTPEVPTVEFPPAVSEDPRSVAETVELLARAEAASVETRVRMLHPEWGEPEIRAEVARIRDDSGAFDPIERATATLRQGTGEPAADEQPAEQ
ncbi:phage portal protein [Thermomonospora cellulosilytica]|uniref:A118 family predicted phage portal protein n=1 Tax=Thermomonospora cellulosilytica TaxID=1411118 RepID=A0A7W3R8U6_9ACTN|nr:phage portal protein [Thermomonospora cellulosilytica]MBA9003675.1 A118 family predicted phage portal protein [Thermomonospora cellulosilytica]